MTRNEIETLRECLRWMGHDEGCADRENGPDTCDCGSDAERFKGETILDEAERRLAGNRFCPHKRTWRRPVSDGVIEERCLDCGATRGEIFIPGAPRQKGLGE